MNYEFIYIYKLSYLPSNTVNLMQLQVGTYRLRIYRVDRLVQKDVTPVC